MSKSAAKANGVGPYIRLLRPKQWTKNLLVFAALIFTGSFLDPHRLALILMAFAAMCLVSSATYIANDLYDVEKDRLHPRKRLRPIAAGLVSESHARLIVVLLGLLGFSLAIPIGRGAALILLTYVALQWAYNGGLKHVPVADVYCIATGFVLRAALGAAAIRMPISGWLLFCTGALALMLGFGKRRNEFVVQGEDRAATRQSLIHYTQSALDAMVVMFATAAALCYGLYTLESQTAAKYPGIILTAPFVFYGISRYVLLVFTLDEGGEPEDVLFRDPHLLASIGLFIVAAAAAILGLHLPLLEK